MLLLTIEGGAENKSPSIVPQPSLVQTTNSYMILEKLQIVLQTDCSFQISKEGEFEKVRTRPPPVGLEHSKKSTLSSLNQHIF